MLLVFIMSFLFYTRLSNYFLFFYFIVYQRIFHLLFSYLEEQFPSCFFDSLRIEFDSTKCEMACIQSYKFNYRYMQIKINFDQLFSSGQQVNSTFEAHSSDFQNSFQSSLNNSFQYKFSLNQPLFEHSTSQSQPIKLIDDDEYQEENKSVQTKKSTKTKQSGTSARLSQPGQRLFYESKQAQMRKNKERQRLKQEKVAELKSMPFVPTINKNSRKLAEKIKTQPREQIKTKPQIKTTKELKEEQLLKQCTFKPKLIAKNNKVQTKSKQELFYYLHNTSKIKEMKLSRKVEEQMEASKMQRVSKEVFIEFLKRNEEYNNVIKKKHEIMKQKANNYDLKTGDKLFSPKITENKFEQIFHKNASNKNILISPKNAQYRTNPLKNQTQKKVFQSQQQKPKMKSNIFAKRNRTDNFEYIQAPHQKESKIQSLSKNIQKQQEYYSEQYRQYTEQFDRRTAEIRQASISQHDIIPQESEHSFHQADQSQENQIQNQNLEGEGQKYQFFDNQVVEQQAQVWNSHEIRPFELSNVNQYLNASEQDEHQPRNNYVMDILNNLMSSKHEQE